MSAPLGAVTPPGPTPAVTRGHTASPADPWQPCLPRRGGSPGKVHCHWALQAADTVVGAGGAASSPPPLRLHHHHLPTSRTRTRTHHTHVYQTPARLPGECSPYIGLSLLSLGSCTWPLAAMVEFTCWRNVDACALCAASRSD